MYVSLLAMVYRWIVVHTGTCFTDGFFRSSLLDVLQMDGYV